MTTLCADCQGRGWYWTEWSDAGHRDPELAALILFASDPPDGTVLITCPTCSHASIDSTGGL